MAHWRLPHHSKLWPCHQERESCPHSDIPPTALHLSQPKQNLPPSVFEEDWCLCRAWYVSSLSQKINCFSAKCLLLVFLRNATLFVLFFGTDVLSSRLMTESKWLRVAGALKWGKILKRCAPSVAPAWLINSVTQFGNTLKTTNCHIGHGPAFLSALTLWLMMMHHHTKFSYKRLSNSWHHPDKIQTQYYVIPPFPPHLHHRWNNKVSSKLTFLSVFQIEVLIFKLGTIDALATSAISVGEVTTLAHEIWDDAMEDGALVAKPFLPSTQGTEVGWTRNSIHIQQCTSLLKALIKL